MDCFGERREQCSARGDRSWATTDCWSALCNSASDRRRYGAWAADDAAAPFEVEAARPEGIGVLIRG